MVDRNIKILHLDQSLGFFDETFPLSNVYLCDIYYDGQHYNSVEQMYQCIKFAAYPHIVAQLLAESDPVRIAQISLTYKQLEPAKWFEIRDQVMEIAITEKVLQNPKVKAFLMHLRGWFLYENEPVNEGFSKHWGMQWEDSDLVGNNTNGRILMRLRRKLQCEAIFKAMPETAAKLFEQLDENPLADVTGLIEVQNFVITRRADQLRIAYGPEDEYYELLEKLELQFLSDLVNHPDYADVIDERFPRYAQWSDVSMRYQAILQNMSPLEREDAQLRYWFATLLQLGTKFTAGWEEIDAELWELFQIKRP